jgi:putative membrane protein
MQDTLSNQDRGQLDELVSEAEKLTKAQIVLALTNRSDAYRELPWIAFALGASIAGLLLFIFNRPFLNWYPQVTVLMIVAITLGCGVTFALLAVLVPGFAKRFLSTHRIEVEVQQYAESLFLARELFDTSNRTGILLLVSLFERKVVILPDKGLANQLTEHAIQNVIATMIPFLKRNNVYQAFKTGLGRLTQVLGTVAHGSDENELPDEIIEESGV